MKIYVESQEITSDVESYFSLYSLAFLSQSYLPALLQTPTCLCPRAMQRLGVRGLHGGRVDVLLLCCSLEPSQLRNQGPPRSGAETSRHGWKPGLAAASLPCVGRETSPASGVGGGSCSGQRGALLFPLEVDWSATLALALALSSNQHVSLGSHLMQLAWWKLLISGVKKVNQIASERLFFMLSLLRW